MKLTLENIYIIEFTLKSLKVILYADLDTFGHFSTTNYDGISHLSNPSNPTPHIQYVSVFIFERR